MELAEPGPSAGQFAATHGEATKPIAGIPLSIANTVELELTDQAVATVKAILDLHDTDYARAWRSSIQSYLARVKKSEDIGELKRMTSPELDVAAAHVVADALGSYRLLLEEVARGGKILIRRRDGRMFEVAIGKP